MLANRIILIGVLLLSGSNVKTTLSILNCILARQLCFEDASCSAILEIIPRVCGPVPVACSTVTVTKCQAALKTLQAFPFFRPTCLCKEPGIDPDCNNFQNFLFDHPCGFVLKKEKDPYPVEALPTCNHALSVCQQERKCIKLFENFKTHCKVRDNKCRMDDRNLCHEAWTNLRLSPMFGCICPNNHMKRRCDRIFAMVNHNPCVVQTMSVEDDYRYSLNMHLVELPLMASVSSLYEQQMVQHHRHTGFGGYGGNDGSVFGHHHHMNVPHAYPYNLSAIMHQAAHHQASSFSSSSSSSAASASSSASSAGDESAGSPPHLDSIFFETGRLPTGRAGSGGAGSGGGYSSERHQSSTDLTNDPHTEIIRIHFQSTCHTALEACREDQSCASAVQPVLKHCDLHRCNRNACMDALKSFYRGAHEALSLDVAFCLCKKTSERHDICMSAQEKLHPVCAQRPPDTVSTQTGLMYQPPPACHTVAEFCKEDSECRARLEHYEQACAVDSVTAKCAGQSGACRKAMLGILGTPLRTTCSCQLSETQQQYECTGWHRLLWLNPCIVESQRDFHMKRLADLGLLETTTPAPTTTTTTTVRTTTLAAATTPAATRRMAAAAATTPPSAAGGSTAGRAGRRGGQAGVAATAATMVAMPTLRTAHLGARFTAAPLPAETKSKAMHGHNGNGNNKKPHKSQVEQVSRAVAIHRATGAEDGDEDAVFDGDDDLDGDVVGVGVGVGAGAEDVDTVDIGDDADDDVDFVGVGGEDDGDSTTASRHSTTVDTASTTTTTTTTMASTVPPRFCVVQRPQQSDQLIPESSTRRIYSPDDSECSELCSCTDALTLSCHALCVPFAPCRTALAFYSHASPAYQAFRGRCLCYSGRFICMRPERGEYQLPGGVFLMLGYSSTDEALLRPYTNLGVQDAIRGLQHYVLRNIANQTSCSLTLFNMTDENIIISARLPHDTKVNQLELLRKEKAQCTGILEVISRQVNNQHSELAAHRLLSIFKMAEVQVVWPEVNSAAPAPVTALWPVIVALVAVLAASSWSRREWPRPAVP